MLYDYIQGFQYPPCRAGLHLLSSGGQNTGTAVSLYKASLRSNFCTISGCLALNCKQRYTVSPRPEAVRLLLGQGLFPCEKKSLDNPLPPSPTSYGLEISIDRKTLYFIYKPSQSFTRKTFSQQMQWLVNPIYKPCSNRTCVASCPGLMAGIIHLFVKMKCF